jgi:hypothetical protein
MIGMQGDPIDEQKQKSEMISNYKDPETMKRLAKFIQPPEATNYLNSGIGLINKSNTIYNGMNGARYEPNENNIYMGKTQSPDHSQESMYNHELMHNMDGNNMIYNNAIQPSIDELLNPDKANKEEQKNKDNFYYISSAGEVRARLNFRRT